MTWANPQQKVACNCFLEWSVLRLFWLLGHLFWPCFCPEELGLYGVALIPSSMINYFRDWGVNSAMTQQIASLKASNRENEIHDVIVSGVIFEIGSGAALALLSFLLSGVLASILQRPESALFISIMSLSILAGAVVSAATSIFVGFEKMKFSSITSVFQAIVKTGFGPVLIVLGFSVLGAIVASIISIATTAILGIGIVFFAIFRPLHCQNKEKCDIKRTLKPMLQYGIPLTLSNVVVGVLPQFFAFMMAIFAGDVIMGNYWAAMFCSVVLTFFSVPISTALFPAFSKVNPKEEKELLRTVFVSSVKYTSILIVPATLIVITLSTPIVYTVYGGKFPFAPIFLAFSSFINLYAIVGHLSLGTFLTGTKETSQLMKMSALSLVLGLPFGTALIIFLNNMGGSSYAVIGGILGILISSAPGLIWGLHWVWKEYRIKADFINSGKILSASCVAAVTTYLFLWFFAFSPWINLSLGLIIFVITYLTVSPLIGAIDKTDVENFRSMFSGLGIFSYILEIPLRFVEKIIDFR